MLDRFLNYIKEKELFSSDETILLAVSGGIDSMVMAHLFLEAGLKTGIAHCNFCLRGNESDGDEEFVRAYSLHNKIPFFSKRFDTKEFARDNGISIQMAARELRYTWFESVRSGNNFDRIAIAHNLNDNIETMLLNLLRGTGMTGLSGIKPSTGRIIRPLLFAKRDEITTYSDVHKVGFREDRSNSTIKYTRNKIRHKIIPLFRQINPSVEITLNDTIARMSELNEIVSLYIKTLSGEISYRTGDLVIFDSEALKSLPGNNSVIFELFRPFGVTGKNLADLLNVIRGRSGGRIITPAFQITSNRKEIVVSPLKEPGPEEHEAHNLKDLREIPAITTAKYLAITDDFKIPSGSDIACLDSGKLIFPLKVRIWKKGDFFYPLGMKHRKKLSDYFVDEKYSLPEKERMLVLESDGSIAWIIGDRIDNRFRITETTKKALILRVKTVNR